MVGTPRSYGGGGRRRGISVYQLGATPSPVSGQRRLPGPSESTDLPPPGAIVPLLHGWVDLARRVVHADGAELPLTDREVALLRFLAARPGEDVDRDTLLREVWGYRPGLPTRAVDLSISRLRRKLERDPAHPVHLRATVGVGYRLDPATPERLPDLATNLPVDPTPLVGRDALHDAATAALATHRLLTLHGPGGIGKSHLARVLAWEGRAGRPGGVWWVDLSEVSTPAGLAGAVAAVVQVDLDRAEDGDHRLARALAGRGPTLLVLDSAEAEVAPFVATCLAGAPALAVLVTRYTPLGLPGEATLQVPPLDDPAAAALYRARARTPEAAFTPRLTLAVGGIPLAIVLAASWSHVVDGDALAQALEEGGADVPLPGAPERHRTLRACIRATLGRLRPDARRLLGATAVHAGAFTLADADAHLGAPALSALGELLDAGLVSRTAEGFRQARPVRSVARAELEAAGGMAQAQAVRLRQTLAALAGAAPLLLTDAVATGLAHIAARLDDVWALWPDVPTPARIALLEGVGPLLRARGPLFALTHRQEELLADPTLDAGARVRVLAAGVVGTRMTRSPGPAHFEAAFRSAPDPAAARMALCGWSLRRAAEDAAGALVLLDEAIPEATGAVALELELVRVALVANLFGEDPTDRRAQAALRATQASPWHRARAALSAARLVNGTVAAERLLADAERVLDALGDATGLGVVELSRAEFVHLPRGDLDRARDEIDRAEARMLRVSPDTFRMRVATPRAAVAAAQGDLDRVRVELEPFREFLRPRVALALAAAELRQFDEAWAHFAHVSLVRDGPHAPPLAAWVRAVLSAEAGERSAARAALAEVLAASFPRGATQLWPQAALLDAVLAPDDPAAPARLDTVEALGLDTVGIRSALPLVRAWVGARGVLPAPRFERLFAGLAVDRSAGARRIGRLLRRA